MAGSHNLYSRTSGAARNSWSNWSNGIYWSNWAYRTYWSGRPIGRDGAHGSGPGLRINGLLFGLGMSDSNDQNREKKVLTLGSKGTLGLGGASKPKPAAPAQPTGGASGVVRQSFSHGREKQVAVEVKKRRTMEKGAVPGVADGGAAARGGFLDTPQPKSLTETPPAKGIRSWWGM